MPFEKRINTEKKKKKLFILASKKTQSWPPNYKLWCDSRPSLHPSIVTSPLRRGRERKERQRMTDWFLTPFLSKVDLTREKREIGETGGNQAVWTTGGGGLKKQSKPKKNNPKTKITATECRRGGGAVATQKPVRRISWRDKTKQFSLHFWSHLSNLSVCCEAIVTHTQTIIAMGAQRYGLKSRMRYRQIYL